MPSVRRVVPGRRVKMRCGVTFLCDRLGECGAVASQAGTWRWDAWGRDAIAGRESDVHWGLVIEVAAVAAVIVAMDVVGRWWRFRQNIRLGIVVRGPRRRVRFRLRHRRARGARLAPVVSLQRYARHRTFVTFRTRSLRDHDAE